MLGTSLLAFVRVQLILLTALGLIGAIACKEKKTKSPGPRPLPQEQREEAPKDDRQAVDERGDERERQPEIVLPSGTAANNLEYRQNETVRLKLGLEGIDGNSRYEFGLVNSPAGAQLLGRDGASPELVWSPAQPGNYDITVVARDMDLCEQVLQSRSDCELRGSSVAVDSRFDVTKSLSFKIGQGNGQGTGFGGSGSGGRNGGGGYGSDQCGDDGLLGGIGSGIVDWLSDIFGGGLGNFFGGDDCDDTGAGNGFGGSNDTGYGGSSSSSSGGYGGGNSSSSGGYGGGW